MTNTRRSHTVLIVKPAQIILNVDYFLIRPFYVEFRKDRVSSEFQTL